jgi:hypothetical protein
LSDQQSIKVTYAGWILPGESDAMSWDNVVTYEYTDSMLTDVLTIKHPEKGTFGAKTTKVKLGGIKNQRDSFKATSEHYWRRHQIMRHHQAGAAS